MSFEVCSKVNLSTLRPEGRGLLEVHPEPCFPTPAFKGGGSHGRTGERLNSLTRNNEENFFFLALCLKARLRFEIGSFNKNKIALDSKIRKEDE